MSGFESPALDYMEERIDFTKTFVKNPLCTYVFECRNDSMLNAFIPPNGKVFIDRSLTPKNGDIVVAVLNGEFTIKWLRKNDHKSFLVPGNRRYREIEITAEMNLEIWGVVVLIVTEPKDVRRCMP